MWHAFFSNSGADTLSTGQLCSNVQHIYYCLGFPLLWMSSEYLCIFEIDCYKFGILYRESVTFIRKVFAMKNAYFVDVIFI